MQTEQRRKMPFCQQSSSVMYFIIRVDNFYIFTKNVLRVDNAIIIPIGAL